MKNWKTFVCLVSIVFLVLAATACQESGATKSTELRGGIQKNTDGNGFFIVSGGKKYQIESDEDLSAMMGKTVTVIGAVSKQDGKFTIVASSVKD